jgi:DNA-directed RNA polymerase specialized sigma24 family protein
MTEPVSDQELLRDFAGRGCESAFQELVRRHADLVFATALRRVGDAAAAEEVTQDVFIVLARKAAWLRADASLAGWAYRATLLQAKQFCQDEMDAYQGVVESRSYLTNVPKGSVNHIVILLTPKLRVHIPAERET